MNIKIKKLTDVCLLREMAEMTTGKTCRMSLLTAYKNLHSLVRTQIFVIKYYGIPTSVMGHYVRHVHAQPYVLSKRLDRGGEDFGIECFDFGQRLDILAENIHESMTEEEVQSFVDALNEMETEVKSWPNKFDRNKPVNMALLLNAEEIINISRARLCSKAAKETREIWQKTLDLIEDIDPDLVKLCKRPCVLYGFCRESKCCGYMTTDAYKEERDDFVGLFEKRSNK